MKTARRCRLCGLITQAKFCSCRGVTKQILPHRIAGELRVDITLSLLYDEQGKLFVLVQKPSGELTIPLTVGDVLHH